MDERKVFILHIEKQKGWRRVHDAIWDTWWKCIGWPLWKRRNGWKQ